MAGQHSCIANDVLAEASCLASGCVGQTERKSAIAYLLWALAKHLGVRPSEQPGELIRAAACYTNLSKSDIANVLLAVIYRYCDGAGVTLPADSAALREASACFDTVPNIDGVIAYLACLIENKLET